MPLYSTAPRIYAFAQFIAGLALLSLSWTIADARYQFRVRCAPIPLRLMTFGVVAGVGTLTLLTDLWLAQHWLVPKGSLITPSEWEASLAGLFLLTVVTWAWFAFVRPPTYGKRNAEHYARTLYRAILQGSLNELPVIAEELMWSARALVSNASEKRDRQRLEARDQTPKEPEKVEAYANDLLLLIGDRRFCRTIVQSSPATAIAIFESMLETKKFRVPIDTFAVNIVSEAIENKGSFIYTEAEGYNSGLLGYHKPLTEAMFGNYQLVDQVGRMFEPDWRERRKWESEQWKAFYRVVLITLEDYVKHHIQDHSAVLYSAMKHSEEAIFDLHKLDGQTISAWEDDILSRLRVIVDFIEAVLKILDESAPASFTYTLRLRDDSGRRHPRAESFLDHLAGVIFEVVWHASTVQSTRELCWTVQHNSVWCDLFSDHDHTGKLSRAVKFKVRRLIYDEISDMNSFPNFKGARLLGLCLNVMGLNEPKKERHRDARALHKVLLRWTKKHYAWMHTVRPRVAESCLIDGMTYDPALRRITNTWPAEGLRSKPYQIHLDVDLPAADAPTLESD